MTWLTDTVLRLAGPLVLVVVFALPALETSTLLGIVVPGELALVLGGVLAHQGRVPLGAAVVAGAAGAVVGDSVGYAIGRRVGERLLAHLPRRLVEPPPGRAGHGAGAPAGRPGGVRRPLHRSAPGAGAGPGRNRRDAVPQLRGLQRCRGRAVGDRVRAARLRRRPAWRTAERVAGQAGLVLLGAIVVGAAAVALLRRRRARRCGRSAPERPGDR
jgi:membrane-associated protein